MSAIKQGYLFKQGGMIKTWKKRYFAIVDRNFQYYEDQATAEKCNCDGSLAIDSIKLDQAKLTLYKTQDVSRPYTLGIQPHGVKRNYLITTESASALRDWVVTLLECGVAYSPGSPTIRDIGGVEDGKKSEFSTIEGFLFKQGGRIKTWKLRYFIVENGCLHYFKGAEPEQLKSAIRSITLENAQIHHLSVTESQQHVSQLPKGSVLLGAATAIRLIPPPEFNLRNFLFVAHNEAQAALWVEKVQRAINGGDVETGLEDEEKLDTFIDEKKEEPQPVVEPTPIIAEPTPEPEPQQAPAPLPVAPAKPERPKKPTRELTPENTAIMFAILDQIANDMQPDLSKLSADALDDINQQLAVLGLSPLEDMVQGVNPVALHPTKTQADGQPLLSTPSLTANLGVTSGWLLRQQDNGEWKLRWCVINRGTKALRYWTSPADLRAHSKPLKTVSLLDAKWSSSNDEQCDIVPKEDCKKRNNDDVFLTIKPVTAFGANKAQESKLQNSKSNLQDEVAGGKKKVDKKLVPLLFAAPNNQLRDKWLEAIKDASKDLDTTDNIETETGDVDPGAKPRSLTGRLSVFAQGLVSNKKEEKPKPKQEEIVEEGNEDAEEETNDIKFNNNSSVLQQQMQREEQRPAAPQVQRQSVIADVRRMPIDSDSDDDVPLPPPRKPTVQPQPTVPSRPARPSPEEEQRKQQEEQQQLQQLQQLQQQQQQQQQRQQEEQRRLQQQEDERRQLEEQQRRQQEMQMQQDDFDEDELREEIENEIINWIKQCEITFPYMLTSLAPLFPMFPHCPQFPQIQQYVSQMSADEFTQIPQDILKDALMQSFNFLHPENLIVYVDRLPGASNKDKQRLLITAEMAAEALESAYDDLIDQIQG